MVGLNDLVSDIAAGAAEQSVGLHQISVAITRIDSIAQEDVLQGSEAVGPLPAGPRDRRPREIRPPVLRAA
ncbi:hypothetical protein Rumeso_00633 [Rubellimicrobium mesophilum DSM 19309]|uniref:Uncharacterized protein n=1 Tax=Rubellimicrobium mesophilum DSM 19309 TaxID=442562 RepID=A0A017HU45_9RHOB|nr:hypothetical protein Rumeso_00633 [Rubellimicrobium mesophilum DSM 19309]